MSIAYIVVVHYHDDSTEQAETPSHVYTDRDAAERAAIGHHGSHVSGYVWEIELP